MGRLCLGLRVEESVQIGSGRITLQQIRGSDKARIVFDFPPDVPITRDNAKVKLARVREALAVGELSQCESRLDLADNQTSDIPAGAKLKG